MPRVTLMTTLRHVSVLRLVLLTLLVYGAILLAIPWLVSVGVPFWVRAAFLAMLPVTGVGLGPWLFTRRR